MMYIKQFFLTLTVSLGVTLAQADDHAPPTQAVAMESAICNFNENKTMADLNDALGVFKRWADGNDYNTLLTLNTPLYIGGGAKGIAEDTDCVLVVNWCHRHDGVS